jgi:DNA-binding NtrC family response regulator
MERELIQRTLEKCQGNKSLAADLLGISRKALYEKISRYGINSLFLFVTPILSSVISSR